MPSLRRYAVSHHAILTLIDVLFRGDPSAPGPSAVPAAPPASLSSAQTRATPAVVYTPAVIELVLRMVNVIVRDDSDMKEALALIGVLPAVMQYASPKCHVSVRHQVRVGRRWMRARRCKRDVLHLLHMCTNLARFRAHGCDHDC